MMIEQFINEKISQMVAYVEAVISQSLHYTELDQFIVDTLEEWSLLSVTDEMPHSTQERVFWHLIHEISLNGAQELSNNLFFKSEMTSCLDFINGIGSYPIDCIGYRPIA